MNLGLSKGRWDFRFNRTHETEMGTIWKCADENLKNGNAFDSPLNLFAIG